MEQYYKIKMFFELGGLIILGIFIVFLILLFLFIMIKSKLDSVFKKNCYDCTYYKSFDVASFGNYCRYKCLKYNRIDSCNMNTKYKYVKCDDFQEG